MKILYSANNFSGSNLFLSRFLEKNTSDIKTLAYFKNHEYLHHIDWTIDGLLSGNKFRQSEVNKIFGTDERLPCLNPDLTLVFYNEIVEWKPDLIISDVEPISAYLAHSLGVDLWYCSPLLLLVGMSWEFKKSPLLNKLTKKINKLPGANKYLINSPFCDILGRPLLKDEFEWVKPYCSLDIKEHNAGLINKIIPQGCVLTKGETSYLTDIMNEEKFAVLMPNDEEQILNAELASFYGVGFNLGNVTDLNLAKERLERINIGNNYFHKQNDLTLDKKICVRWLSI